LADITPVHEALHTIGQKGTRREIGLLQQVILHESPTLQLLALNAVHEIRTRQVIQQRKTFRHALSQWQYRGHTRTPKSTLGPKETECMEYAQWIVSQWPTVVTQPNKGNPKLMLQQGRPKAALSAIIETQGHDARMLEGQIREELGDVYGALAVYSVEFADGHEEAGDRLRSYGVHPERLLLGLLATRGNDTGTADDTAILNVLVRSGGTLTVLVLAERTRHPIPSEQGVAVDALARMLEPAERIVPLTKTGQKAAKQAIVSASIHHAEPIRSIALEALHQIPR